MATKRDASKNREMGVALALGGRHLIGRYNNQIGFGDRGRRDVGEEARGGWSVWGGGIKSFEVTNSNNEKNIYKMHRCLLTVADRQRLIQQSTKNRRP